MSEHTPLPWRYDAADIKSESALETIAMVDFDNDNWEANAALIVEAVNNYDALRAELDAVKAASRNLIESVEFSERIGRKGSGLDDALIELAKLTEETA